MRPGNTGRTPAQPHASTGRTLARQHVSTSAPDARQPRTLASAPMIQTQESPAARLHKRQAFAHGQRSADID